MEQQIRRRRRPALSCLACRRRKIKCDRNSPCAHCISAGIQCAFQLHRDEPVQQQALPQGSIGESASSSSAPAPLLSAQTQTPRITTAGPVTVQGSSPLRTAAALPSRLASAAAATEPLIRPFSGRDGNQSAASNNDAVTPTNTRDTVSNPGYETSVADRLLIVAEAYQGMLMPQSNAPDVSITASKEKILTSSHWGGMAAEFAPILACYAEVMGHRKGAFSQGDVTRVMIAEIGDLLRKCKSIARSMKAGRPSRCPQGPWFGLEPPSREVADKMATTYFRSFESTHRILHEPTFWTEYQRYWNQPESATTAVCLRILLVIAIGSSLYGNSETDPGFCDMAHRWVYAAQAWLSGPLEKDRLNLAGLQIHCLTILARQVLSIGGDLVWVSAGSLIHSAMQIALHRDPKHLPAMSPLRRELRRRLWATILEVTVQSSLDAAMPPRISLDEFDTEPPSNINDDEMDESTTDIQPHPRDIFTTTSIQLMLLDSLPTRLRTVQFLNNLRSERSYPDALELSSSITDACRACGTYLHEHKDPGTTPFRRNLLDYLVRRFLLPLHGLFAAQARTNPLFHYSLKTSLDTAMVLISPEPDGAFSNLIAAAGGLFRETFRCAATTICIELLAQVDAQRLDGTLRRNAQYRDLLKKTVGDMISFSAERIRRGETNIKTHMFLSMILAHAEAMEEGAPSEARIAQSARDSGEFCYNMLRAMAGTNSVPSPDDTDFAPVGLDSMEEGHWLDSDAEFLLGTEFM